jgi:zinc and cadmium transporter
VANFVSAATIVPGALLAYYVSSGVDVTFLLSFAAGNFIYIAASDLIPEVTHDRRLLNNLIHFGAFVGGIALIVLPRVLLEA